MGKFCSGVWDISYSSLGIYALGCNQGVPFDKTLRRWVVNKRLFGKLKLKIDDFVEYFCFDWGFALSLFLIYILGIVSCFFIYLFVNIN